MCGLLTISSLSACQSKLSGFASWFFLDDTFCRLNPLFLNPEQYRQVVHVEGFGNNRALSTALSTSPCCKSSCVRLLDFGTVSTASAAVPYLLTTAVLDFLTAYCVPIIYLVVYLQNVF